MTIRRRIAKWLAEFLENLSDYSHWRSQDLHYYAETGRNRIADIVSVHLGMDEEKEDGKR